MNKKMIRYFDKQMTEPEQAQFELEMAKSPRLQERYAAFTRSMDDLNMLKQVPPLPSYFAEARGRFRANLESKRRTSFFSQYALAGSGVFSLTIMLFLGISFNLLRFEQPAFDSSVSNNSLVDEMTLDKAEMPTAEYLVTEDAKTTSILEKKMNDEIGIKAENSENIIQDLEVGTDELVQNLRPDEIDPVLNQIK